MPPPQKPDGRPVPRNGTSLLVLSNNLPNTHSSWHNLCLDDQQKHAALYIAAITRRTNDSTMNSDLIYPEHRRQLPTDFRGNSLPYKPYQPYKQLVIGLGINISKPNTRQEVPTMAAALLDHTQTKRVLKQVSKPLYVIKDVLTKNAIQNMLPTDYGARMV